MIGTKIKQLREQAKLPQADFADKIGISQSALGNYERGERIPDAEVIARISERFSVSSDWLLGLSKIRTREQSTADLLGIADTSLSYIKNMDISIKECIDDVILYHGSAITTLFLNLYVIDCLCEDISSGKDFDNVRGFVDKYYNSNPPAECELLYGYNKLIVEKYRLSKVFEQLTEEFIKHKLRKGR